jgi:ketosteroid isomerase-like protein
MEDALIEKEIFQIESDILIAIKRKDSKKLDEILTDYFIYRNPMEGDRSRAEFLAAIKSLPVEILSVWSENMRITILGDAVVASGIQKARTLNDDGEEELSASAFVDVFVRHQGKWQLAWAHGVDLPSVPDTPGNPQPGTV